MSHPLERPWQVVGVDTGGTFTDFVVLNANGEQTVLKQLSTPHDPSEAVLHGLHTLVQAGAIRPGYLLVHGTTVATNALLQRSGACTELITTAGFKDVLEIGRQARPALYALEPRKPEPLLAPEARHEVRERMDWQGRPVHPLDRDMVRVLVEDMARRGVESVAICFLFSYLNPEHEREAGAMAAEAGLCVSISSEVAPEPREYERTNTTVANAQVAPVMGRYLRRLADGVRSAATNLLVFQSNGGALTAPEAARIPIRTVLSGPAGGAVAAAALARRHRVERALTFDMGGTSTDVSLIVRGVLESTPAGQIGGLPIRTPMLDIETVGAGGGSLVAVDSAGGLRVGPASAGADPGPVAYGRGKTLTVTDAHVFLGHLPASIALADSVPLRLDRVVAAFDRLAARIGTTPQKAAAGVIAIANARMARALRAVSTARGHDIADAALISFGGCGGLHACDLAQELGMRRILAPRYPGAFSALGLAISDVRRSYVRHMPPLGDWSAAPHATAARVARAVADLREEAARHAAENGVEAAALAFVFTLEMRYVQQGFTLEIAFSPERPLDDTAAAFHVRHAQRYGHADSSEPVEIIAVRCLATSPGIGDPNTAQIARSRRHASGLDGTSVVVVLRGGAAETRVTQRDALAPGDRMRGPALVLQSDATTLIDVGWEATVQIDGTLALERFTEEGT